MRVVAGQMLDEAAEVSSSDVNEKQEETKVIKENRLAASALVLAAVACVLAVASWQSGRGSASAVTSGEWLKGTADEQLRTVERQLRGLDVAMAENGYRFTELYFAGQDGNWDYAKYQAEKIDLALRLALERRPNRAKSAQPFLNADLPAVLQAIASRDRDAFERAMARLRASCMDCHVSEKVPYFTVEIPERRVSPIRTIR